MNKQTIKILSNLRYKYVGHDNFIHERMDIFLHVVQLDSRTIQITNNITSSKRRFIIGYYGMLVSHFRLLSEIYYERLRALTNMQDVKSEYKILKEMQQEKKHENKTTH